jgi:starch phosphorylase
MKHAPGGAAGNLFTTHTPVPGRASIGSRTEMIQHYFKDYVGSLIRLDMEGLLALGRENVYNKNESFSMAVLALRTSDAANGVSEAARRRSAAICGGTSGPNVPAEEVPIGHVTNGIHARTWLSSGYHPHASTVTCR